MKKLLLIGLLSLSLFSCSNDEPTPVQTIQSTPVTDACEAMRDEINNTYNLQMMILIEEGTPEAICSQLPALQAERMAYLEMACELAAD